MRRGRIEEEIRSEEDCKGWEQERRRGKRKGRRR
jgi:hypothetical protein